MSFRRNGFLHRLLMIVIAIGAFEGAAYAQFSVTIPGPASASTPAPTGQFTVTAEVSGNINTISKVVFYRNDVPYQTFLGSSSSSYVLTQDNLGQDTYTYRARAYGPGGGVDSNNFTLSVRTRQVIRMGDKEPVKTDPPGRFVDHTEDIREAIAWLADHDGGTLFFPCTIPGDDGIAIYNIRETINIPSNVTLQGESAEANGKCRIYWNDVYVWPPDEPGCHPTPGHLLGAPMFRIVGDPLIGTSRVRFKDLALYSRTTGPNCPTRSDFDQIANDETTAIEMNTDYMGSSGNITDVIIENVSIRNFTWGISARSGTEKEISDIKIRAYRAVQNHRQLYIDATYAYNWDVQNLNINYMSMVTEGGVPIVVQGGVEIVNAGKPASPAGENTKLKFLQLNCNGGLRAAPDSFCVRVEKHGGLYFRQLHHEGVNHALIVQNIYPRTNPEPIVIESGAATGKFYDASMKLYTIGSSIFAAPEVADPRLDSGRLRFIGPGVYSTVMDCGDIHWDVTVTTAEQSDPPPPLDWPDLGMYYSHSERNRGSFFAEDSAGNKYIKPHIICPQEGASGLNVNEVGGEYFDSGAMPMEPDTYPHVLSDATCDANCNPAIKLAALLLLGGTVYVEDSFTLDRAVTVPSGSQIVGASPDVMLTLSASNTNLFTIEAPQAINDIPPTSGIVIRDLTLKTTGPGNTGIAIVGAAAAVGASTDLHFSGLTIEGFENGFYVRPTSVDPMGDPASPQPMVDGLSLKNSSFINNQTAVRSLSANASNWNILNLRMTSDSDYAIGWDQKGGGHQSLQNVTCQGSPGASMLHCMRLSMSGSYLAGLKQTNYVENALTIWKSNFTHLVVRDSDFRSSTMNLLGRAFIVSMNNKYDNINVESPGSNEQYFGEYSRLTYCGDTYDGGVYSELAPRHPNLIVGVPTLTRVSCGPRPIPWDDAVRFGENEGDKPLVGNFFDDFREDFVIYRPGSQSQFLIKQAGGIGTEASIPWGLDGDRPMIGRFFPDSRAQIVIWRPSSGYFWVYDPRLFASNTATSDGWHWGQNGDVPFIGNFLDESGSVGGNKDEIAVYRPSEQTFYIANPRSLNHTATFWSNADPLSDIHVGDFLGFGYDQIAQYKDGVWKIIDPQHPTVSYDPQTLADAEAGDIPVVGKYLPGTCTQLGVWRPSSQEFVIADYSTCGSRNARMIWGSNNGSTSVKEFDIPLTINAVDGLRRPTAYRPTKGAYPYSIANGQWWVHDPFPF